MINFTLRRTVAVAILVGASFGAHATEKDLGNIATNVPTVFAGSVLSFTLPSDLGTGGIGFAVENFPLTLPNNGGSFNTLLTSVSLVSDPDGIRFDSDDKVLQTVSATGNGPISFSSFDSSLHGSAYVSVAGIANGTSGGLYNGAISISPVPEPEAFAMLLAGLGLMGAVVRRRGTRKTA
jgi:PEP-CTERM motif